MSVLVKGMEMPKNGWKYIMLTSDGKAYRFEEFTAGNTVTRYEAVEVPPHGRLGDLDKLEQMFVDIDNAPYSGFDGEEPFYSAEDAALIIRLNPTVIPADKDGET